MLFLKLTSLATVTVLAFAGEIARGQEPKDNDQLRSGLSRRLSSPEAELSHFRADVIQKIKETRSGAEKVLMLHETERQRIAVEYERRRKLYHQGLIARNDVLQTENALAQAMLRVEEDKRRLAETDMVITEVTMRDELLRLPGLALGASGETSTLLRFNGGTLWQLRDAARIERFFVETFGRALPISALGQTITHDRLRFDHRDAMDVALHPDSKEGQSLLGFLRQAGIPFVAFRKAIAGSATGAHIHIGNPSARLVNNSQGLRP